MNDSPENQKSSQVEDLFVAALALDPAQRSAYVSEHCGADSALRQRVEALLLAHHAAKTGFLPEQATLEPTVKLDFLPPPVLSEQPGDQIGRYKLLQKIGEGGCGVVYMTEQEQPVRRRVALKVIKLGMDTKEVVARFEAERQALAMMDHPNIAKVLDAGATETGRPFFVMELVRGIKITDYCDQNKISARERLELFVHVCRAVQHAHQKGIIHRDLKPSNILVTLHDGVPIPKVIDFGIAKATQGRLTDQTVFTAFEQFIGTPAYMSPEQAEMSGLDIDTRSDIYSLGVLLYELLTGETPFNGADLIQAGLDEMRRTIREKEPAKPSTRLSTMLAADLAGAAIRRHTDAPKLISFIRGDLDWIVMKCIEKDRTRRYETANGLAADVQRHLANEPVTASPPSRVYRLQKLARRNKLAFSAAAAIAAVLLVATVVSAWQAVRATRAEDRATERLAEADAVSSFLTEVFKSPDPDRDGRSVTVAEMLDKSAAKLEQSLTNQPTRQAQFETTLAGTYFALGLYHEAIPLAEKARDFFLTQRDHENSDYFKTIRTLADSYDGAGRRGDALKLREEALALSRKIYGTEHHNTLVSMGNLGISYNRVGREADALDLQEKMLALSRKVNGPEHPATLIAMEDLATSYEHSGRQGEALQLRAETLALSQKVNGTNHPKTLIEMNNLANSYEETDRQKEALALRKETLALARNVNGSDDPALVTELNNLAWSYQAAGQFSEALPLYEEALGLSRKGDEPKFSRAAWVMKNLAVAFARSGNWSNAVAQFAPLVQLEPTNHYLYHSLVPLLVQIGDLESYRAICAQELDLFGATTNAEIADRMAKDCLILPNAGVNLSAVVKWADLAVTAGTGNYLPYFQFSKGLAEYRQGRFAGAIDWMHKVLTSSFAQRDAQAYSVLAMAEQQLGQHANARASLAQAADVINIQMPQLESGDIGGDWIAWLIAHALFKEAGSLLDESPTASK